MNKQHTKFRLLLLALMLGLNSFQMVFAASTFFSFSGQAGDHCMMSQQHDMETDITDDRAAKHDCCMDENMPAGQCNEQSCPIVSHAFSLFLAPEISPLASLPPVSEDVTSIPSPLNSQYLSAEYRPPRV